MRPGSNRAKNRMREVSVIKGKFEIRRSMAVLALVIASIGGGLVASMAVNGHGNTVPVFVSTAHAASVEPSQMFSFASVVKHTAPAVVNISSTKVIKASAEQQPRRGRRGQGNGGASPFDDPLFRQFFGDGNDMGPGGMSPFAVPRDRRESSLGSGVIVSPEGYILTNNHVVEGATTVKVLLSDKREFTAKIVGTDPQTDVAVVKIDGNSLPVLPLSGTTPQVGDIALAIGNPFGIGQTVTMGIVGATGRNLGGTIEQYEDFIQTDAAINPGNSGGALINTRGELIGINTAIISGSGGNQGIGFAVPVTLAKNIMDQLMRTGKVTRGYIGAMLQDVDPGLAKAFHLPNQNGAVITNIEPNSPAEKGGLKGGDVIVSVNGEPVSDVAGLRLRVASFAPGTAVKFHVLREGQPHDVTVTLAERPANLEARDNSGRGPQGPGHQSGLEGVSVDDLTPQIARQLQLPAGTVGAVVTDVNESSPAAEAGLQRGDVIEQVNNTPVKSAADFEKMVRQGSRNGQTLLLINHQGVTRYIAIESK
jgi:serine protease Do